MKFYNVQIPYRGIIPILSRRGPIASIELTIEQVNTMLDYGVPLLDPNNGKELKREDFEENQVKEEAKANSVQPVTQKPQEVQTPAPEEKVDPQPEPPIETADDGSEVAAEKESDDAATEEAIETSEDDEIVEPANTTGPEFDFNKIKNYSSLSKSKKKALRTMFADLVAQGTDINIIYAELNAEAAKK